MTTTRGEKKKKKKKRKREKLEWAASQEFLKVYRVVIIIRSCPGRLP